MTRHAEILYYDTKECDMCDEVKPCTIIRSLGTDVLIVCSDCAENFAKTAREIEKVIEENIIKLNKGRNMKNKFLSNYLKIAISIIILVVILGFLLPCLISANSDEAVIVGIGIIIIIVGIVINIIKNKIKEVVKWVTKEF